MWELVQAAWTLDLVHKSPTDVSFEDWWILDRATANLPKDCRRIKAAVIMYTAWNLWKKRSRRTFGGNEVEPQPLMVLQLVEEKLT